MKKQAFYTLLALIVCTTLLYSCTTNKNEQIMMIDANLLVNEYVSLSKEYEKLEMYEEALSLLLKAKSYSYDSTEINYLIARSSALAKNWEVSLQYYHDLLLLDPENLLLQKSVAWVTAQKGEIENALELYTNLYEMHSYDKEITTNYIVLLIVNDKKDTAQAVLDTFSQMYPEEQALEELQAKISEKNDEN